LRIVRNQQAKICIFIATLLLVAAGTVWGFFRGNQSITSVIGMIIALAAVAIAVGNYFRNRPLHFAMVAASWLGAALVAWADRRATSTAVFAVLAFIFASSAWAERSNAQRSPTPREPGFRSDSDLGV
jgi:hypothetical protein